MTMTTFASKQSVKASSIEDSILDKLDADKKAKTSTKGSATSRVSFDSTNGVLYVEIKKPSKSTAKFDLTFTLENPKKFPFRSIAANYDWSGNTSVYSWSGTRGGKKMVWRSMEGSCPSGTDKCLLQIPTVKSLMELKLN